MFIREQSYLWPVRVMCSVLSVHPSGYYKWLRRPASETTAEELSLLKTIREIHRKSKCTIGSRRMVEELAGKGVSVGRHRVRRLMRHDGLVVKRTPRHRGIATTDSNHRYQVSDNLLRRNFTATAPNQKWSCDITYIRTLSGFVYLAIVMDLYSRRIIGWHVSQDRTQQLTIKAVWKAWKARKQATGMIIHSDRGVEYAAHGYRNFIQRYCKAKQSMSRRGNCWDNAPVESFFATLKIEECESAPFRDLYHVQHRLGYYIEHVYNRRRLHSTLGYQTPVAFEGQFFKQLKLSS